MLTLKQVKDVCLEGHNSLQCRFLAEDEAVGGNYYCLKMIARQRANIDAEVDDFIDKHRSRGNNPHTSGLPLGDNCGGYRFLKVKMQGYDLDGRVP